MAMTVARGRIKAYVAIKMENGTQRIPNIVAEPDEFKLMDLETAIMNLREDNHLKTTFYKEVVLVTSGQPASN